MAGIVKYVDYTDWDGSVTIKVERLWSFESVRSCCVRNHFFNAGTNEDYLKVLKHVDGSSPTPANIYKVAKAILENTPGQNVENIMFCLEADAVHTFYEIE